jgi:hypothetical protein
VNYTNSLQIAIRTLWEDEDSVLAQETAVLTDAFRGVFFVILHGYFEYTLNWSRPLLSTSFLLHYSHHLLIHHYTAVEQTSLKNKTKIYCNKSVLNCHFKLILLCRLHLKSR